MPRLAWSHSNMRDLHPRKMCEVLDIYGQEMKKIMLKTKITSKKKVLREKTKVVNAISKFLHRTESI